MPMNKKTRNKRKPVKGKISPKLHKYVREELHDREYKKDRNTRIHETRKKYKPLRRAAPSRRSW